MCIICCINVVSHSYIKSKSSDDDDDVNFMMTDNASIPDLIPSSINSIKILKIYYNINLKYTT